MVEKLLLQRQRGGFFSPAVQPLCVLPTDGCPVGPGPRVNISILNHSPSRSPTARARSSSKSRWSASDRWKTCCPQTWRGKNSPGEGCGLGHFHISIRKGGLWWRGRGLIRNCYNRLCELRLHPTREEGVTIRCTTQAPLLRGVAVERGSDTVFRQKWPRVPRNWLAVAFVAKTTAFLSVHLQNGLSRAKAAFSFMAV